MRQSLACQFLTAFSRNVLVQKLTIINFGDNFKRFSTKLSNETILQAEIGGHSVSMAYQSYSENVFDQKLEILTKFTKKFWNFENFENF